MELEVLKQITNLGFPAVLFALFALGAKRLWSDVWVWWKEVFWPGREQRWAEQSSSSAERDAEYRKLAESFIAAMRDYQDGFQARNQSEHQLIIREMEKLTETTVNSMELLVTEVRGWHTEICGALEELLEGR